MGVKNKTMKNYNAPENIPPQTRRKLIEMIAGLEREHGVRILYACESGSRAWGFPSPNSDFDGRFIYAHPRDWYFSLEEERDVIEIPTDGILDLGGWDLRKTLRLVMKSNPVIWEWLQSPIVYKNIDPGLMKNFWQVIEPWYSPITACHHYLALCQGTIKAELTGEKVKIKKYFYMLRPILAALWVAELQTIPPMEFEPLLEMIQDKPLFLEKIRDLETLKMSTDEKIPIVRIPEIDEFLWATGSRLEDLAGKLPSKKGSKMDLNEFFRSTISGL